MRRIHDQEGCAEGGNRDRSDSTRGFDARHNGHPKCHYCGACGSGCDVGAFFNASDYLIEPALKTGRLNVVNNAVVARILVGPDGLANGVQYFDRCTKEERRVYGKRVVVAASCVDSTRILLNSTSSRYPNGIGNSSDVIGRYLSEQIRFTIQGFAPELMGGPVQNDDGIGGAHMYMPRFIIAMGEGGIIFAGSDASLGTRERRPIFRMPRAFRVLAWSLRKQ